MMNDWNGWSWWWMALPMVLFWGTVACVIFFVARRASAPARGARDVLDERYARGEIDTDEYRTRRDALRG
jgi:putative membrane protein